MSLAKSVEIAFAAGIALLVLTLGLRTTWDDVTYLFRRPVQLLKSLLARNVIVPAAAILLIRAFSLEPPIPAVLAALSVTAVPPVLPVSLLKQGGRDKYAIGLLASQTLLAIVLIPASLSAFNAIFGTQAHFGPAQVAASVARLVIAPFALGMVVHYLWPPVADRIASPLHKLAMGVLLVACVAVISQSWRTWAGFVGDGTLMAMALLVLSGLVAGHILGGSREQDRTSLALAAASSHPGLAIALVSANAPAQARAAFAAVFLYLVVRAFVTYPYTRHRREPRFEQWRVGGDRRGTARPGPDRRRVLG